MDMLQIPPAKDASWWGSEGVSFLVQCPPPPNILPMDIRMDSTLLAFCKVQQIWFSIQTWVHEGIHLLDILVFIAYVISFVAMDFNFCIYCYRIFIFLENFNFAQKTCNIKSFPGQVQLLVTSQTYSFSFHDNNTELPLKTYT